MSVLFAKTITKNYFCNYKISYNMRYGFTRTATAVPAITAGDCRKNARAITAIVKELAEETKSKNTAEAQEIQEYLTQVIRGQIDEDCIVVESIGDYQSRARNVKKQVTPKDRIKACETLAKMRGYFDLTIKIDNAPTIIDDIK